MIFKNKKDFNFINNKLINLNERLFTINNTLDYRVDYDNLKITIGTLDLQSVQDFLDFIKKKNGKVQAYQDKIRLQKQQEKEEKKKREDELFKNNKDKVCFQDMKEIFDYDEMPIGVTFIFKYGNLIKDIDCYFNDYDCLSDLWDDWQSNKFNTGIIDFARKVADDYIKNL